MGGFRQGQEPWLEHLRMAQSKCDFVNFRETNNVKLESTDIGKWRPRARLLSSTIEPSMQHIPVPIASKTLFYVHQPMRIEYASEQARRKSFETVNWNEETHPSITHMVSAGFYGTSDVSAYCWSCLQGFHNYHPQSNVINDHDYHYKSCLLAKLRLHSIEKHQVKETEEMSLEELGDEVENLCTRTLCSICQDLDTFADYA